MFFVLSDIIQIPYGNAGGHFAHLGGSLVGFIYARQIKNGKDIFDSFSSIIINFFVKKKKNENKILMNDFKNIFHKDINQKKIDEILDKINSSGYDSLSKEEKDFLFKNGKN